MLRKRFSKALNKEIKIPNMGERYMGRRTVLVTGASGMIGSALVRKLLSFGMERYYEKRKPVIA